MKDKNVYIGITFLILGLSYFTYYFNPILFNKILNLWPILILICSLVLQYLYFELRLSPLVIISGFSLVYGAMYTLNLYIDFIDTHSSIAIFFLAIATSLLSYYIFINPSYILLPFIFLFISIAIIIFLYPFYKIFIPVINTELTISTIFILIGVYLIFSTLISYIK